MWPNPQFPTDLVTFTEEILNENLHFLCSVLVEEGVKRTPNFLAKTRNTREASATRGVCS